MGIGAMWVQLVCMDPSVPVEANPETFDSIYAQRKKGLVGGPGTPVAPGRMRLLHHAANMHAITLLLLLETRDNQTRTGRVTTYSCSRVGSNNSLTHVQTTVCGHYIRDISIQLAKHVGVKIGHCLLL